MITHPVDAASAGDVSLFDERPFFEKALQHGVRHGLIDRARLDAMAQEAPKGLVQIARYFGSEYLRPELERARARFVNLISLHLQAASGGDLSQAARLLQEHSLLSRSKAGSDMLKALIVMPQSTHFGMNEQGGFADRHIAQLARWSLASFAAYQTELQARQRAARVVDAALWLARRLGMSADELVEHEPDAEAVIRTSLLLHALGRRELPDWPMFEKLILALRRKPPEAVVSAMTLPPGLPAESVQAVEPVRQSVLSDLPRLMDSRWSVRKLFDQTPAFMGRYFWVEDALAEVSQFDRQRSVAWDKLTQGHQDDSSLLTLLLCVAAGSRPNTLLTEKSAAALVRKLRKSGFQVERSADFLKLHAPEQHQHDYGRLWEDFVTESRSTLLSDSDTQLRDALALLRRECNVSA